MQFHLIRPRLSVPFLFAYLLFSTSCSKDDTSTALSEEELQINLTARAEAKELYEDYYLASATNSSDTAWTGNEASCDPGSTPLATINKIFQRLAYFRMAVGLNNEILENATKSAKAQKAALMMNANNQLNHSPGSNWKCYSDEGKEGAGNSLLTTAKNAESMDSYIRDYGSDNGPVGHRRWLLWPRLNEIGIGNTSKSNAIWVLGNAGPIPEDAPDFIAWPPKGHVPNNLVYPRWSFSIKDADFNDTEVSMKDASGNSISVQLEDLSNAFGDRTIVWVPDGISTNSAEDITYTVKIKNVGLDGQQLDFEYKVILFDPNL